MTDTPTTCETCGGTNCTSPRDLPYGVVCRNDEHNCPACSTDTPVEAYVITPEQLRARDERIIRAAFNYSWNNCYSPLGPDEAQADAIIATAGVNQ